MKDIIIYTDGACKKNPGPGGYAAIVLYGIHENHITDENTKIVKEIVGGSDDTTNNIMELKGVYNALNYVYSIITRKDNSAKILKNGLNIYVYTDSNYVLKGITIWYKSWEKKNFVNVKNSDIWKNLIAIYNDILENNCNIVFKKVKGHSGDKYNEMVDKLASDRANEIMNS